MLAYVLVKLAIVYSYIIIFSQKTMAGPQACIKSGYYDYPEAKQGPKVPFSNTPGANPVLRGLPLAVAGSACVKVTVTMIPC